MGPRYVDHRPGRRRNHPPGTPTTTTGGSGRLLGLLAFLSFLSLWWMRWALPLFPLGAVAAVFLLDRVQRKLSGRLARRWLQVGGVVVALLLVWPLLSPTIDLVSTRATGSDIRLRANEWILDNVPAGSTLLVDSYTTQVSSDVYDLRLIHHGEIKEWSEFSSRSRPRGFFEIMTTQWYGTPDELLEAIEAEGIDYIALGDIWLDVFHGEGEDYAYPLALCETLEEAYPIAARFDRDDGRLGWPVTLLSAPGRQEP